MYVCVNVCMYVCLSVCMHACMQIYMLSSWCRRLITHFKHSDRLVKYEMGQPRRMSVHSKCQGTYVHIYIYINNRYIMYMCTYIYIYIY